MTTQAPLYRDYYHASLTQIEGTLAEWLNRFQEPAPLWGAMRYACTNGGKRLRPVLLLESTLACGGSIEQAMPSAIALELIHCYSLIHDDLPCMDNDDLRRGKPTTHKAFDEATALLAGDALNAWVYSQLITHSQSLPAETLLRLVLELSTIASVGPNGHDGLVSGQVLDMQASHHDDVPLAEQEKQLHQIHAGKTAALITFACKAGAIITQQPEAIIAQFEQLGQHMGLLFQIKDDLLDVQADTATLGKTTGKDIEQAKLTFPAVYGVEASEAALSSEADAALIILNHLTASPDTSTIKTDGLRQMLQFFTQRES